MEFWQWIMPHSSGEILSALTRGGRNGYLHYVSVGEEIEISDLPWPLVLGLNPDDKKQFALPLKASVLRALSSPLVFCFAMHRDREKLQPLFEPNISELLGLTTLAEFLQHIADACEAAGILLMGQEVHVPASRLDITFSFEKPKLGHDVVRPLMLLRAALEMMAHARGIVASDFELQLSGTFHRIDLKLLESIQTPSVLPAFEARV
jgi:hypothetical protein